MPLAGQVLQALWMPQVVVEMRSSSNISGVGQTPVPLITATGVLLHQEVAYHLWGFARARWETSADNDGQAQIEIVVGGTSIAVARARPHSTNTARTNTMLAVRRWWSPPSTGSYEVVLTGSRTAVSGTSSDLEFRGSGGEQFETWLMVEVAGRASAS